LWEVVHRHLLPTLHPFCSSVSREIFESVEFGPEAPPAIVLVATFDELAMMI